jgi:hypothetical protein
MNDDELRDVYHGTMNRLSAVIKGELAEKITKYGGLEGYMIVMGSTEMVYANLIAKTIGGGRSDAEIANLAIELVLRVRRLTSDFSKEKLEGGDRRFEFPN